MRPPYRRGRTFLWLSCGTCVGVFVPPSGSVAQLVPVPARGWRGCLSPHRGDRFRPTKPGGIRDNRSRNRQQLPGEIPHGSLALACSPKGEQTVGPIAGVPDIATLPPTVW